MSFFYNKKFATSISNIASLCVVNGWFGNKVNPFIELAFCVSNNVDIFAFNHIQLVSAVKPTNTDLVAYMLRSFNTIPVPLIHPDKSVEIYMPCANSV